MHRLCRYIGINAVVWARETQFPWGAGDYVPCRVWAEPRSQNIFGKAGFKVSRRSGGFEERPGVDTYCKWPALPAGKSVAIFRR